MDKVLVSLIMPAFNSGKYIADSLESVLNQTYSNLEIIVVDDGSTDDSWEIINEYAKKDARIIPIHKENGGVTSARLVGVEKATGDYIGFVDADDYVEPDMFEFLLNNALEYAADISHCGYQMVFPTGRKIEFFGSGKLIEEVNPTCDLLEGRFVEPGLVNKLFDRNLFDELLQKKLMNTEIKINEDLLMNYYLFRGAKKAIFQDECKYHYMVHQGSAANSTLKEHHMLDPIKVAKIIIKDSLANAPICNLAKRRLMILLIDLATKPLKENPALIKPHRKWARREVRKQFWRVLRGAFPSSIKIKTVWVSIWPQSYLWMRQAYLRLTGKDQIYSTED